MEKYLRKQITIVTCLYLGELVVGCLAWTSPVIPTLTDPDETPLSRAITEQEASWIVASSMPGVLIGASLSGLLINVLGRKPCLQLGGMLIMTSYLLLATAGEFWMVVVGRCVDGIGAGIVYLTNLTYIAVISSTNIRGTLLTAPGIFTSAGILLTYITGPFFSYVGIMYMGFFISMVFTIGTLFIPETPVFHILKGREYEAKKTLLLLGRSEDVEEVLSEKSSSTKSKVHGLRDLFIIPTNRKALLLGLVLFGCQGLSGYVNTIFQVTAIFQSVNSSINPDLATIIVGVTQLVSSCLAPLFVDKMGRKKLLMISSGGCSLSMALFGVYLIFHPSNDHTPSQYHWIPLISLMGFLISYLSGLFSIPGAYASEVFDSSARGPGCTIIFAFGSIVCFTISALYGYINVYIGNYLNFFIFAASSAFVCMFAGVFVIETKGKSLAEVQMLLSKR